MSAIRYGCLYSATILAAVVVAIVIGIGLSGVVGPGSALSVGMAVAALGAFAIIWRIRRSVTPRTPSAPTFDAANAPGAEGGAVLATEAQMLPTAAQRPFAVEAETVLAAARARNPLASATQRVEPSAIWAARVVAAFLGPLLLWLLLTSGPDTGEATWGLGVLGLIGAIALARSLRGSPSRILLLIGEASVGMAVGIAFFFGLTFALAMLQSQ